MPMSERVVRKLLQAGVAALLLITGVLAMAAPLTSWLFSEVTGVLRRDGQPLADVRVVRQYDYHGITETDTRTDAEGCFHFPEATTLSAGGLLLQEYVVAQKLYIEVDGERHEIWSNTRRSRDNLAELGGRALVLTCELNDAMTLHREFGSILRTRCRW